MILRGFFALVGVAALAIAVLWTWGLIYVLGESRGPGHSLVGYECRSLIILGVLGMGALIVVFGCGLAYARTAARAWITPVIAGSVCAIPILVVWIDLAEVFSGSN